MAASAPDIGELKELINKGKEVDKKWQSLADEDRSTLARLIVKSFIFLIFAIVGIVAISASYCSWEHTAELAKFLASILGSILLPVVTLVIGYYFGNK